MPHAIATSAPTRKVHAYAHRTAPSLRLVAAFDVVLPRGAKSSWIHLAYVGRWEGHPKGPFEFTRETFDRIVANFDAQRNPIKVDYEHGSYFAQPGTPIAAAGYIHKLERRGDHLWAFVEWAPRAAAMIARREYRFSSVVVNFAAIDRRTSKAIGPRLTTVGLTDEPFIDGQVPIALSERRPARALGGSHMPNIEKLLKAAGLPPEASREQLMAVIDAAYALMSAYGTESEKAASSRELVGSIATALGDKTALEKAKLVALVDAALVDPPAEEAAEGGGGGACDAAVQLVADAMGVSLDEAAMFIEQHAADIAALAAAPMSDVAAKDGTTVALKAATIRIEGLVAKVKALSEKVGVHEKSESERKQKELEARVDAIIDAGTAPDSKRAELLALGTKDPTALAIFEGDDAPTFVPQGRVADEAAAKAKATAEQGRGLTLSDRDALARVPESKKELYRMMRQTGISQARALKECGAN